MRYDEKEEIKATGEWLLSINQAGFSEELMYVPSQLSKMAVEESDDSVEKLEYRSIAPIPDVETLILDYDRYDAWEWAEPIEKMIEEAFASIFDLEPGLPYFNELASLSRSRHRMKGKRARAVVMSMTPLERVDELVSDNSVGTST